MATIIYQLEKKSLDELLIHAACCKWEVSAEFFNNKESRRGGKDKNTDKRRMLYWLLWTDCQMTFSAIAERFNYQKSSMQDGIEKIDFMKGVYPSIANDIANIREIAGKLQVSMEVEVNVKIK